MSPARVAVVGAGYFAAFHLRGWQDAGAQVVGLADLDLDRARALAQRFGVAAVHTGLGPLLALSPTLVDVVLPPQAQESRVRLLAAAYDPCVAVRVVRVVPDVETPHA